ncbi:hypothetical protein CC78DRAFT_226717 [Lojkania enalia]|uniref:C2H2-type domain-containing protein n=1 Tax=Lojkania enalia TaxID=147567 RepID=A0A9P4KAZ1_9PLEO|nr:hypothetical protein CC78DRAFT_226717 [Didymosphaeria enalia]
MARPYAPALPYPTPSTPFSLASIAEMADGFPDNEGDSAFGDDGLPWFDPMLPSMSTSPPRGTKRDADDLDDSQPAAPGTGRNVNRRNEAEVTASRTTAYSSTHQILPFRQVMAGQPSFKRRASTASVAQLQMPPATVNPSSDLYLSSRPFPKAPGKTTSQTVSKLTNSSVFPCPSSDDECSQDNRCDNPDCVQEQYQEDCGECAQLSYPAEPCYEKSCREAPCPKGEACYKTGIQPTPGGTILSYGDAPYHFQGAISHSTVPMFNDLQYDPRQNPQGYPVTSQASNTATPALSPGDITSLDSFSHQSSPLPPSSSNQQCVFNIPWAHCHRNKLECCHDPSLPHESYRPIFNGDFNSLNVSYWLGEQTEDHQMNFAFPAFNAGGFPNSMLESSDSSWMLPDHELPSNFQTSGFGSDNKIAESELPSNFHTTELGPDHKLNFLALAAHDPVLKEEYNFADSLFADEPGTSSLLDDRPATSMSGSPPEVCVCKWEIGPDILCGEVFDNPEELHKHIKSAHVSNCTRCNCQWEDCEARDKDFKQRSKLTRHMLGHAGYRPYACSFEGCSKTFATNQAKDNHERTHTGVRPYQCTHCGYTTTTHTQLQTHISALHEKQKPHKCRFCEFTCADSSNLSKHERTHQVHLSIQTFDIPILILKQTLRPYRCPHPGCTFKPDCRWENLKRHLRRSGHCPKILNEDSTEHKDYRENARREAEEWQKRHDTGAILSSRKKRPKQE